VLLLQERDILLLQFQDLKAQMNKLHSSEHERLIKITVLSNDALKSLKAKRAKVK
jgi:hypothetical protein